MPNYYNGRPVVEKTFKCTTYDNDVKSAATYTDYTNALEEVSEEYFKARENFPDFRSRHEGIAIIEEEFLEFRNAAMWPHKNEGDDAYTEAKQLATMAIRYMVDIGHG